jgi:chemotaxis protein methyltransferase CheR
VPQRHAVFLARPQLARLPDAGRRDAASGGLILGAGETVIGQTDLFQLNPAGRGVYEKCDPDDPIRSL